MVDDLQEAYRRGKQDGEREALKQAVDKAHARLDDHDIKLNSHERIMYAGMGILAFINAIPILRDFFGTQ